MAPERAAPPTRRERLRSALDPVSRATELLFGLIMVLTFTATFNAAESGRIEVRMMLIAALGCNLAWGLIDAAMYLLSTRGEQALAARTLSDVRGAISPEAARAVIAEALPPIVRPALKAEDLERIRRHVTSLPESGPNLKLGATDYLAAFAVFLLVFVGTLPVVMPFVFFRDPQFALWISHAVAIAMLFLTGWKLGQHWGQPWRVGLSMVAIGLVLVAVALALGG
jgi:VIT1/CCC1 family predicted Fe2+/Mn2+ transporter